MAWFGAAAALVLIGVVFVDAFEAMMLPRRVRHAYRFSRLFYHTGWSIWLTLARLIPAAPGTLRWRHGFLSIFGPLSLFALMAVWAVGLIAGFALFQWSLDTSLSVPSGSEADFPAYLYLSGTTFFTLGYGDMVPTGTLGRALCVAEAGIGFGFLAVVISYLPVLYQAFSHREITISLLDARAGSPPSAGELLQRLANAHNLDSVGPLLAEWERWAAELLESHLSFPVLRFYRSQHDNQSWVAALTTVLDTSALLLTGVQGPHGYQARLTFAMARHAAVDLVLVSQVPPLPLDFDRLPADDLKFVFASLRRAGLTMSDETTAARVLAELRGLYEPFVNALATDLRFTLPPFVVKRPPVDNWQTSPGMAPSPGLSDLQASSARDEHKD